MTLRQIRSTIALASIACLAWPLVPASGEELFTQSIRQGPQLLKAAECGVGRYIADVSFEDIFGQPHRLSDYSDRKAVVVVLTGTGCPLCQKYAPTLAELEQRYHDKQVAFVFVNPNASEGLERLKETIRSHGFQGPYARDTEQTFTRALGAKTSTEVFVLDAARTLIYRGAVDDQYGFGYALEAPRHHYLTDALDAVLAGRVPEIAATSAPGCELFFDSASEPDKSEAVATTYHNQISRIVQQHCLECHRDGGLAPFSLESYQDVKDYAGMVRSVVQRGVMPPWFATPQDSSGEDNAKLHWANDRSLPEAAKAQLLAWVESGAPLGDPAEAPLPRTFPTQWMIGKPDVTFQIPDPIEVQASGRMPYRHAQVKTHFDEDRWVQAVELQPTDRAAVHHVLVFAQQGRQRGGEISEQAGFFAAYVPGNSYQKYPQGFAKKLPAGTTLTFQIHYTPYGTKTTDQTQLGLIFAEEPPQHEIRNVGIANDDISIPPSAGNHKEQAVQKVPTDVRALAFMPHMHLRGKAIRYDLVSPEGQRRQLLDVARYDFNWQLEYRLAEPLDIPRGSRIEVTGWFDNSDGNPANPDPTKEVGWGPQTEDEMLLGYVEYFVPGETATDLAHPLEKAFRKADRDGDGKVTRQELPKKQLFDRFDTNQDDVITHDEVLAIAPRDGN